MLQISTPEYYRVCHASVYKEQMRSSIPDSRHGWTIGNKEDTASHCMLRDLFLQLPFLGLDSSQLLSCSGIRILGLARC